VWVRVTLNGTRAAGNKLIGSRASDIVKWHARQYLVLENGIWKRPTGNDEENDQNDVALDYIQIDAQLP